MSYEQTDEPRPTSPGYADQTDAELYAAAVAAGVGFDLVTTTDQLCYSLPLRGGRAHLARVRDIDTAIRDRFQTFALYVKARLWSEMDAERLFRAALAMGFTFRVVTGDVLETYVPTNRKPWRQAVLWTVDKEMRRRGSSFQDNVREWVREEQRRIQCEA